MSRNPDLTLFIHTLGATGVIFPCNIHSPLRISKF